MGSQIALDRKCFVADVTDFRLLPLVNGDYVTLQVFGINISFVALVTRVLPLSTMGLSHVPVQIILFVKLFVTLRALH